MKADQCRTSFYRSIMYVPMSRQMGHIREIKCQIPHISPPTLSTRAKFAKWGAYMRDTTIHGVGFLF